MSDFVATNFDGTLSHSRRYSARQHEQSPATIEPARTRSRRTVPAGTTEEESRLYKLYHASTEDMWEAQDEDIIGACLFA
jgi:hypothetical protein